MVDKLIENFRKFRTHVSENALSLFPLDYFPENCGGFSEEQGKCFHKDLRGMEERYQGLWNVKFSSMFSTTGSL